MSVDTQEPKLTGLEKARAAKAAKKAALDAAKAPQAPRAVQPKQAIPQRTISEPTAVPQAAHLDDLVIIEAHPEYDYGFCFDKIPEMTGHNKYDLSYYRNQGYKVLDYVRREDQDVEIHYLHGAIDKRPAGATIVFRHKDVGLRKREQERLKNNPPMDMGPSPEKARNPGGDFYQETKAIRPDQLGESLYSKADIDALEQETIHANERIARNPDTQAVLDRVSEDAEKAALAD